MFVGITNYTWSESNNPRRVMVVSQGNIFVGVCKTPPANQLSASASGSASATASSLITQTLFCKVFDKASTGLAGGAIDPHFSPDGTKLAFVQDAELFVLNLVPDEALGNKPIQMTFGARASGKTHALADFIAQEEMDRYRGYWWGPDSKTIAYVEVDESNIPEFHIAHSGKDEIVQESHRYPFAGKENATIGLGIVTVPDANQEEQAQTKWLQLFDEEDMYLARVNWLVDGSLVAQIQNREQNVSTLKRFHPIGSDTSLIGRTLLKEKSKYWTNLHHNLRSFMHEDQLYLLWTSEADGYMHVYLYKISTSSTVPYGASLVHQLTWGDWVVEDIVGVNAESGFVYVTGTATTPLERHLYRIKLWTQSEKVTKACGEQMTVGSGMHSISMSKDCTLYVDEFSSLQVSPEASLWAIPSTNALRQADRSWVYESNVHLNLQDAAGPRKICDLFYQPIKQNSVAPSIVSFPAADGSTVLYGAVYEPDRTKFGDGPFKTIVWLYGGPHVQLVKNEWRLHANARVRMLNKAGYLVFVCDNRGSSRRGADFEGAMKHNMGDIEVQDQVEGVKYLVSQKLSDPNKVGCFGWSYGGYMTCMCLARAPTVFSVGVAGAPVTHWDGYDTHYTERYMGTPENNAEGYKVSSVMHHVQNISGNLMLIHGLIDENVHFRHTARLINALIDHNVPYDLLLFPCERHSPRKVQDHVYMADRIKSFFSKHLQ